MTTKNWDFSSFDGVSLKIHEIGQGRPLILLHGLFSNAQTNWIKFGHADALAEAGFRVIMPDLRAHGDSAAPHDPAAYPADILVKDTEALIAHLGFSDFDLGGFSLGARTTARMLATGTTPGKAGGITFLLGAYQIGPYSDGPYWIALPQSAFRALLNPAYADQFDGAPVKAGDVTPKNG